MSKYEKDEKDIGDLSRKNYAIKRDEKMMEFLAEKSIKVDYPITDQALLSEFKKLSGATEHISHLRNRFKPLRNKIHESTKLDEKTKLRMLFVSSASVPSNFLKKLRRDALVEVDENNRITKYKANNGSLELEGEHSQSAKKKAENVRKSMEKSELSKPSENDTDGKWNEDSDQLSGDEFAVSDEDDCSDVPEGIVDIKERSKKKTETEASSSLKQKKSLSDDSVRTDGLHGTNENPGLILRKVSKSFRSLVDQQKPSCDRIIISFLEQYFKWEFNDTCLIYVPAGSVKNWMSQAKKDGRIILVVSDDFEKIAFNDLTYTLKNPKLYLKTLSFKFHEGTNTLSKNVQEKYLQVRRELSNMNHQISAKEYVIQMVHPSKYRPILPFLMPGVLETISVNKDVIERLGMAHLKTYEQICQLEQWKQAKELKLTHVLENFPLEYATHFKRFQIIEPGLMSSDLIRIRNFLSELDNFETCTIISGLPFDARHYSTVAGRPAAPNKRTEYVSHYPIRNSEDYLKFMFIEKTIEVQRKKH